MTKKRSRNSCRHCDIHGNLQHVKKRHKWGNLLQLYFCEKLLSCVQKLEEDKNKMCIKVIASLVQ